MELFAIKTQRAGPRGHYRARRLVLAVGDMTYPNLLGIPGEESAPMSLTYFRDPRRVFPEAASDRRRASNSAAEAALRRWRAGADDVSYRRARFDERKINIGYCPILRPRFSRQSIGVPAEDSTGGDHAGASGADADSRWSSCRRWRADGLEDRLCVAQHRFSWRSAAS